MRIGSTSRKWIALQGALLFVGAVVLFPAAHRVAIGGCCDPAHACDSEGGDDAERPPPDSDPHDPSTCPVCKVSGTALVVSLGNSLVDSLCPVTELAPVHVAACLPVYFVGLPGARAPPR